MPIYSYRCENCGHSQDVLQKMSDPVLVACPSCGAPSFRKQVTAAGFQLKGSGWYVSDFRNPAAAKSASDKDGGSPSATSSDDKSAATVNAGANEKAVSVTKDKASSTGSSDTSSSSSAKSSASSVKSSGSSTSEST